MIWTCGRAGLLLLALSLTGCRVSAPVPETPLPAVSAPPPAPASAALYTAAGAVRALATGPDGSLWAATAGGALCWRPGQVQPSRWAAEDGLAGSDVRAVQPLETGALAATPTRLCRLDAAPEPKRAAGAPTGELRGLVRDGTGTVWLATSGGVFRRTDGGWRLAYPGEAWRLTTDGTDAWAVTTEGLRNLSDGRLLPLPVGKADLGTVTALAASPQGIFLASALGLWRYDGRPWQEIPLPPGSSASHVSALCANGGGIYAGLYGDGVYQWQPAGWERLPNVPAQTREVTALAVLPTGLAVGTRGEGVWDVIGDRWTARALPDALPSGDVYGLAAYRGALWASTFDSGLLKMDGPGPARVSRADGLRSVSPRALVVFGDRLYARHTTGQLDCTEDGRYWRPAFPAKDLPRSMVSAVSTDGTRLYVGGWAGWSAWDGQAWDHHDHDPALAHQVVTAIAARPGEVWIGTQKQGLFVYANGRYTHLYEAQDLTDDWITCLSVSPARVLIGTYTGGLLQWDGTRFTIQLKPQSYAIRAVCLRPGDGRALAATPLGVYEETATGWRLLDPRLGGLETQALLAGPAGLWVGSRTGLAFVPSGLLLPPAYGKIARNL